MIICLVLTLVTLTVAKDTSDVNGELVKERARRILMEDNFYAVMKRLDALETEFASFKSQHAPSNIAFKAHLTTSLPPLGSKQLIDFNEVQFNNGHAYHGGTFIAPYNGTYLFSVYICSPSGHWVAVDIMRNTLKIGQAMSGDDEYNDSTSQTIVTDLTAGDDVNVHHHSSRGGVLGSSTHLNTFTGVLLNVAN